MKRLLALVLAMALCLAACAPAAPVETTAPTTVPTEAPTAPVSDNPVTFFSLTLGEDYENIGALTAFSNDDGTAYVEYVGDVKKVGNLDMSIFQDITAALSSSGLAALSGQDSYLEGEANGSMYIELADGTMLTCGFSGEIPQEYRDGYAVMADCFARLTADMAEYVPQPTVLGEVEETMLNELLAIITGSGIQNPDGFTISQVARDEYFAYTLGLSADTGIADAAQCAPMMMTTAYSLSIVKLEEGADAETVCADFAGNVDWQKWVCVMPTNALVAVKDNMVLCLVAADELYAMTASGIESTGWTVVETLENNM